MHALAPRKISFLAFAASNVLVDIEPAYFMLTGQHPLHRFFHTYLGAMLAAAATVAVFAALLRTAKVFPLPDPFQWQSLRLGPIVLGAVLGTASHVLLDSVMHADIRPFAPFSQANPLYRAAPLDDLHRLCLLAAAAAIVVLVLRRLAGAHRR
jgi:hypothetical protein